MTFGLAPRTRQFLFAGAVALCLVHLEAIFPPAPPGVPVPIGEAD